MKKIILLALLMIFLSGCSKIDYHEMLMGTENVTLLPNENDSEKIDLSLIMGKWEITDEYWGWSNDYDDNPNEIKGNIIEIHDTSFIYNGEKYEVKSTKSINEIADSYAFEGYKQYEYFNFLNLKLDETFIRIFVSADVGSWSEIKFPKTFSIYTTENKDEKNKYYLGCYNNGVETIIFKIERAN